MATRDDGRVSARKRAETHTSGFDRTKFSVPDGTDMFEPNAKKPMRLDILPYRVGKGNPQAEPGELYFERTYWAHRGVGANNDDYVCPAKTAGKKCPICEHASELRRDPDADKDLIKGLAPKERQLWNLIDLDAPEKGVQLWDVSFHLFGKYLDEAVKASEPGEDEYEYFSDLKSGSTLKVSFSSESFGGHAYCDTARIDFKQRATPYKKDILEQTHCLDDLIIIKSYKELAKIYFQEPEEEEEEETTPPPKKRQAAPAAADEDDEDDTPPPPAKKKPKPAPVEEDEEDEPTPPPKKKPKPAPVVEEEDEEDEPAPPPKKKPKPAPVEDEEDDEPAPPPKKKPAAKPAAAEDEDWDDWEDD